VARVSYRSVVIAVILIPLNALWLANTELMWLSGQPTTLSLLFNVIFILTWLVLANLLVARFKPGWALDPGELLVVYVMLSLATALQSMDYFNTLIPPLAHLYRYQPMEHRYDALMPYAPNWLLVKDPTALEAYYIGQESIFDPANFVPWLGPLAWWLCFIVALCAVMGGLNLLLRKQWTENEKLSYPIIQLPMMLTTQPRRLLRNKAFWLGFGIVAAIDLVNGVNVLFPLLPKIPIVNVVNLQELFTERPWRDMGGAWVSFYPFAIGMAFFMPLDLAFSCVFFFWVWKLQYVLTSHFGVHGMPGFPFVAEQGAGAYHAVALIALWISRRHLARCGRILLGLPVDGVTANDRRDVWMASGLLAAGGAFLFFFCWKARMTPWIILLYFGLYFLFAIGITRMRAELGPPSHDLHFMGPAQQVVTFLGAPRMNSHYPYDLTMFAPFYFMNRCQRGLPMPHAMEGLRIAERTDMNPRRLMVAMGVAVVAGTVCGFWAILWVLDKHGAAAQALGWGQWHGDEAWNMVNTWFTSPTPHQAQPTIALMLGLLFSLGLAVLRMSLAWWPLHPVGYAISGAWTMTELWLPILIGWLVKLLLLKYGGARSFRPAVPFFLGLIMGDFMVGGFWTLFGAVGGCEVYHFWPF